MPKEKALTFVQRMLRRFHGLGELLEAIKKTAEKGSIKAIDGRKIKVDSSHKALNYLLQSSAGVIAKRWMVIVHNHIKQVGICASQLCFLHDELHHELNNYNYAALNWHSSMTNFSLR